MVNPNKLQKKAMISRVRLVVGLDTEATEKKRSVLVNPNRKDKISRFIN
jgi:hypothetical protein